jgi:hypothetical protein
MTMDNETIVSRDKKNVNRAELKAGLNVVVDARGDSLKDPPGPRSAARSSADDETVGEATQETQQGL